ncbi:acyclic terpene utilization AtuA family protein [Actinomadura geliboluensis]|uniref:acyclic terpene utilization AtuA family protein n=1 Tax=Actinomadura geliboluensis TaxID=882440 RepID=UPI003718E1DB
MGRPVRIANFSGFYGDRAEALGDMLRGSAADVLTGDYLAEVTMSVLSKLRARDAEAGFARTFLAHLRPVLDEFAAGQARIVVNAGGLNPAGLATAIRAMASEAGHCLDIATVSGDDVTDRVVDLGLADYGFVPATANAYLGGWGITRALSGGARIVICGRVADASLAIGAAAWWHGWTRDAWDELAGALIAGHLIECGPQVTGGNFSGFLRTDLSRLSFPIAEIADDGSSTITKLAGSSGLVSTDTVTAQLVYEIQGRWYANPDVVADLSTVRLRQAGPDVVAVSGTIGAPPPPTTKVALTGADGWENSMLIGLTGLDFEAKRDIFDHAVRTALDAVDGIDQLRIELIGHQAESPTSQNEATGFIHVVASGPDQHAVGRTFSGTLVELALATFPGVYFTTPPRKATPRGVYRSALVAQSQVEHHVTDAHGVTSSIAPPVRTREFDDGFEPGQDPARAFTPYPGPVVRAPLGAVVETRSGDKGANANLGVWTATEDRWSWLRGWLTVARLRELLPEAEHLPIDRVELPNLRAINFVIRDLLGEGAISSPRLDSQAKGLGEFIRARRVDLPVALLRPDQT